MKSMSTALKTWPRVSIYGAGAVGSHIASRLINANVASVALVGRGAHLAAIRSFGLTLIDHDERIEVSVPNATDDPTTLPKQDVVLVTLKAVSQPAAARQIAELLAPNGVAVFLANGIPWWWEYGIREDARTLRLLDPHDELWNLVRPERSLAGVIYSPNEIVAPGVVRCLGRTRFVLGAPDNQDSQVLQQVLEVFVRSGMAAAAARDIRREILLKLVVNSAGNPLAALTRLGVAKRNDDKELVAIGIRMVEEVLDVSQAMGWHLRADVDVERAVTQRDLPTSGRPSMLQDTINGRPIEYDAILGQVAAFARQYGMATPVIDVVLPLLRGLDRGIRGL